MSMATRTDTQSPAPHAADSHDLIRVHGARVNNLKDVSIEIPKRRLTVFTGVSGSGKSSLVFEHDRRGVAAADQRDLQRLRAGLHADAGAARGRRTRRADDRDHRRPAADGRRPPLHGRHRHRRQRDAAHPLQPARQAAHRPAQRVLLQRRLGPGERRDHRRARCRQDQDREGDLQPHRRHVHALRGPGQGLRHRPHPALRRLQVARRGRVHHPRLEVGQPVDRAALRPVGLPRPGQADPQVHQEGDAGLPLRRADQGEGQRRQPHLRGADPQDPEVVPVQGQGGDAAAHPGVRGAGGHLHHLPRVRRHPAQRGGPLVEDQADQHRRRLRDADQRPGRVGPRPRRAVGGAAAHRAAADPRLVRGDRPRLPLARPAVGHAVGRRGAARQDDPPPRLLAHRRHLRLRRAHHRACTRTTSSG